MNEWVCVHRFVAMETRVTAFKSVNDESFRFFFVSAFLQQKLPTSKLIWIYEHFDQKCHSFFGAYIYTYTFKLYFLVWYAWNRNNTHQVAWNSYLFQIQFDHLAHKYTNITYITDNYHRSLNWTNFEVALITHIIGVWFKFRFFDLKWY